MRQKPTDNKHKSPDRKVTRQKNTRQKEHRQKNARQRTPDKKHQTKSTRRIPFEVITMGPPLVHSPERCGIKIQGYVKGTVGFLFQKGARVRVDGAHVVETRGFHTTPVATILIPSIFDKNCRKPVLQDWGLRRPLQYKKDSGKQKSPNPPKKLVDPPRKRPFLTHPSTQSQR